MARITTFLENLRRDKPDAKNGYVGFCWGGRYAIALNPLFDAIVAAHPSMVRFPSELDAIVKPISFVLARQTTTMTVVAGKRLKSCSKLMRRLLCILALSTGLLLELICRKRRRRRGTRRWIKWWIGSNNTWFNV
ncbi:hypothetical protein C8F04DRAFT_549197 [Mycena alexandri]|uniref:Dienelactone hydrolase domain-containing protein n=1 Tax=Mycena alexandri TaxID=1745969 RepID=A0AAD6X4W7_9AGAR|nr:hypothetical protein C8F04DRAFT_549197 [Mycena alexandri]